MTPIAQVRSPWAIEFSGAKGLTLAYDGVPIIRQSTLFVVKPGWAGLLFDGRNQKPEVESYSGEQPTLRVIQGNENFRTEYRFEALDATHFRLQFRGYLTRDVPASLEYAAGYFNANLLSNRPFRARTTQGERVGVVPFAPASADQLANDVAPNFRSLTFDSRLGTLEVQARSSSRVVFFDARRDPQEWARNSPIFWCGWLAGMQSLEFGHPVELRLDIILTPHPQGAHEGLEMTPRLQKVKAAQSAREHPIQIIPQAQKLEALPGKPFVISTRTPLILEEPRGETRLTSAVNRILGAQTPLAARTANIKEHTGGWARLSWGKVPSWESKPTEKEAWWINPEGYRLRASHQSIEIVAPTAQGAFYGLQTLVQLLRPASAGMSCPAVDVEDWPSRAFRGAHWFPAASGVAFDKKLITNVLARTKFNACVIQCEAARWDTNPKIAAPNSISKSDLRTLVQTCRDNFIEPIPLINVPGHAEWMFRNGQNLDLAEDPETPYAYSVNNPKSLALVESVLSEAIEVFHPTIFHLGHDEVSLRGRFPNPNNPFYRPDVTEGDLVLDNLRRLHDWLQTRGIKTMIWSDMLLASDEGVDAAHAPNSAEAKRRRSLVPSDVIVADWHYGSNETYPSLNLLRDSGLETLATTWQTPLNIRNFARAAQGNSLGLLQTTWAGYFPDETTLKNEVRQYAAFVLAGDYAWSNRAEQPTDLLYDPLVEWTRSYNGPGESFKEVGGTLVNLSEAARVPASDWLGLGAGHDVIALVAPNLPAQRRYDDVLFDVPPRQLVVLGRAQGRGLVPSAALGALTLKVGRKIRELALLQTALWSTPPNTPIGYMEVAYDDGTVSSWEVMQGRNVTSWQNDNGASEARRARVAPKANSDGLGKDWVLRVARWVNPYPEKRVVRLRLTAVAPESGWDIAGLTLLD